MAVSENAIPTPQPKRGGAYTFDCEDGNLEPPVHGFDEIRTSARRCGAHWILGDVPLAKANPNV